jgi:CRP/FNR family cyclic AMP-dependent transcriptional regulator
MRRIFYILSLLSDDDVDWLVSVGERLDIPAGKAIITEGEGIHAIYIILAGRFTVTVGERRTKLADLSAGEMVGEISLIDSRPPTATVTATEPSVVLRMSDTMVHARLRTDSAFGARLYKSIAVFLAQRLRSTVTSLGYSTSQSLDEDIEAQDEIDPDLLDSLSLAGARFNVILDRLQNK